MANNTVFHGPNAGYVLELYDRYLIDPAAIDAETRAWFDEWGPPVVTANGLSGATATAAPVDVARILSAAAFAQGIRTYGHQAAKTIPVGAPTWKIREVEAETYGLSEQDLSDLPASVAGGPVSEGAANALEAIQRLRAIYSGSIGYEFDHVQLLRERNWLRDAAESGRYSVPLDAASRRALLERLTDVEAFERFLHTTFLGAKRFSIEGADSLVPILDQIVRDCAATGTEEVVIGMAHRGRLNVLTHVLGKPYEVIFDEFDHGPRAGVAASGSSDTGWTGDVKYHLGRRRAVGKGGGIIVDVPVIMAPNPSHLEYVNPVVEGMTRASQETRDQPGEPEHDQTVALAIVLHGDAAFPGQGVVAETLNLSRLKGYRTGGTIHIIVNNMIGYTTDPHDSRSTLYASDLAKGYEIPIVHVNADDPEACLAVARMAIEYRNQFKRDFLIDLIGYRRWGHNEGDDPSFTQPRMYAEIQARPTVRALWAQRLEQEGVIAPGEGEQLVSAALDRMRELKEAETPADASLAEPNDGHVEMPRGPVETGFPKPRLIAANDSLHTFPDTFTLNPKLLRQLQRRRDALDREGGIDWALAESLAFASIVLEGTPVRLSGQDAERGTFAQRHLALHDPENGQRHVPLQALPDSASFAIYNSPLSEAAVLGFEYGYSVHAPDTLVLWEAQFGDFANSAQVIVDQFIVAAEAKWRQSSSLVMLLPHGYEGQGPEHSSARLERFLQLCAGRNMRVANCTTSAQYFHLLRRQAATLLTDPRPLIVMTPKSLLRHPKAGSSLDDLAQGHFQTAIDDAAARGRADEVGRVVLCSGKVYVDLITSDAFEQARDIALVRVEELHPFPSERVAEIISGYPGASEIVWLQEEPKNMGAWSHVAPRIQEVIGAGMTVRYIGRPERASPAEGSADVHAIEQSRIVAAAFSGARALQLTPGADD
ncbi:MAG TPA: 2-oxoglutarate dehydrogenase E1 component [Thermomicrobiales bacterium]|nr:2-oxoglutarate dehydrogenase E1 component [Thermomicrobiales bacterium]